MFKKVVSQPKAEKEKIRSFVIKDCEKCKGVEPETKESVIDDFKCKICTDCGECISYVKVHVEKKKENKKPSKKLVYSENPINVEINKIYQESTFIQTKGIASNSIDLIVEDTPYGYSYQSNARKDKFDIIHNDSSLEWLDEHVSECFRILKDNSAAYFFCQDVVIDIFKKTIEKYFKINNILTWEKGGGGMGDLEGSQAKDTEFIIFASKGSHKLRTKRKGTVIKCKKDSGSQYQHPTQKPVNLIRGLILDSSDEGNLVFDGFMGRGTTAMASIIEKRNFLGFELDPDNFETCQENIEKTKKGINVLDSKVLKQSPKSSQISEQLNLF